MSYSVLSIEACVSPHLRRVDFALPNYFRSPQWFGVQSSPVQCFTICCCCFAVTLLTARSSRMDLASRDRSFRQFWICSWVMALRTTSKTTVASYRLHHLPRTHEHQPVNSAVSPAGDNPDEYWHGSWYLYTRHLAMNRENICHHFGVHIPSLPGLHDRWRGFSVCPSVCLVCSIRINNSWTESRRHFKLDGNNILPNAPLTGSLSQIKVTQGDWIFELTPHYSISLLTTFADALRWGRITQQRNAVPSAARCAYVTISQLYNTQPSSTWRSVYRGGCDAADLLALHSTRNIVWSCRPAPNHDVEDE